MPARNNRSRRQASEEIEDPSTQAEATGPEVTEEPRKRQRRHKQPEAAAADDAAPNDDEEDEIIDVKNFGQHPLTDSEAPKLRGIAQDWAQMASKLEMCFRGPSDAAAAVADALQGEDLDKNLAELELLMKELIDIKEEMSIHHTALDDMYQRTKSHEEITDAVNQYENSVAQLVQEYKSKTARKKYAKAEAFKNFKESVWTAQNPDAAMPPMSEFLAKEPGDDSDSEDDLEMGGVTQDFKCPLTLRILEKPLKSRVCGHVFSESALQELFNQSTGTKSCPAAGCKRQFRLSDCLPDKDTEKKVKLWERRQRRRQEEMDDGEVVE